MGLSINTNFASMMTQRGLSNASNGIKTTMERLSTGCRINSAADDAAGLSLSENIKGQISGNQQANRNAQEGVSMLQIAEGGLSCIADLLQRGRELSVQAANGVYSQDEKDAMQKEVAQIIDEVQKISDTTKYNDMGLLDGTYGEGLSDFQKDVITSLQSGWLQDAQDKISTHYGLTPSNFDMELYFHDDMASGASAYVSYSKYVPSGDLASLSLHINEADFNPNTGPSGENAISGSSTGMYNDMILAHEMTHAIIADTINQDIPLWFNEGCAEFLVGRDNQLKAVTSGGDPARVAGLVEEAAQLVVDEDWYGTGSYFNYSVGYFATKFLDDELASNGNNMADVFDRLEAGDDLETAIAANTSWSSMSDFQSALRADGAAYYNSLSFTGGVGVAEADTGSIQGSDHGGPALTAENVITQTPGHSDNPTNFNIIYPESEGNPIELQIGANVEDTIDVVGVDASSAALGIEGIDVSYDAREAIRLFDNAINLVSDYRSDFGSMQNKLEGLTETLSSRAYNYEASNSTIRDADIGKESANLAKMQILQQASASLLTQANQNAGTILSLL